VPLAMEHETKAEPERWGTREEWIGVEWSKVEWRGGLPQCICDKWQACRPGRPLKASDNSRTEPNRAEQSDDYEEVKDLRSEIAHFGCEPGLGQFFVCYLG